MPAHAETALALTQNRLGKLARKSKEGTRTKDVEDGVAGIQAYQDAVGVVKRRFGCDRDLVVPNHSKLVLVLARVCFYDVSPQAAVQMVDVEWGCLVMRNKSGMNGQRHTNHGGRTPD